MLYATTVSTKNELEQIQKLNSQNLKQSLSKQEIQHEGFVSWPYSIELLEKLHKLAPSIIIKDDDEVVGYALVTLKDAGSFHPDLQTMIRNLQSVYYLDKPLMEYNFYIMGQICIDKNYRGKGLFNTLYRHHKSTYGNAYELLITEISAKNKRSIKAHEKFGFKNIHTFRDSLDEWNVVAWNWGDSEPF